MVAKEKIKQRYTSLVEMLEIEALHNASICEFIDYVKSYKLEFNSVNSEIDVPRLREFIRGANRFSDEFLFTEPNGSQIKRTLQDLYNDLNVQRSH